MQKEVDQLQKQKEKFLLKWRKSISPKQNPESISRNNFLHEKNHHLSPRSRKSYKSIDLKKEDLNKIKRVTSFRSYSPSPTNIKPASLKKQKAIPTFLKNKAHIIGKSPEERQVKQKISYFQFETRKKKEKNNEKLNKTEAFLPQKRY